MAGFQNGNNMLVTKRLKDVRLGDTFYFTGVKYKAIKITREKDELYGDKHCFVYTNPAPKYMGRPYFIMNDDPADIIRNKEPDEMGLDFL